MTQTKPLEDYCAILGVSRSATKDELKRVYRRFARQLHPDINPDAAAQELFKKIAEAFDILTDPEKRRLCDFGMSSSFKANSGYRAAPQKSTADQTREFLRHGGTAEPEMLLEALKDNCGYQGIMGDAETANLLLRANVIPDQETLEYAVRTMQSSYWVAKLIRYGAEPTREMLDYAVKNRLDLVARELINGGVPATSEAVRLTAKAKPQGGWLFS